MFGPNYLKGFFCLSLVVVFLLPTYIYFYLAPKFTALIIENSEHEAEEVTNHLISMFFPGSQKLTKELAQQKLSQQDKKIQAQFHIEKIKIFLANGEVIYSSDEKDIGVTNTNRYFTEIVMQGKLYSKVVEKEKETLEGRRVRVDVVEIYVPIMKNGAFVGAFEIYYDISGIKSRINNLMSRVYLVFFIVLSILLSAIFILYYRAGKSISQRKRLREEQERNYETEIVFNNLLQLSLVRTSLEELLEIFIYNITSLPWLEVEPIGALFLLDDESDELKLKAQRGLHKELLSSCASVPLGKCICGRTAATGLEYFSDCVDDDHDITYEGMIPHGHYSVPISSSTGKVIGVFTLYTKMGVEHNPRAEEIFVAASKLVAGIIERKQLEKKLHDISISDELTGLLNRRGFITLAQKQLDLADRNRFMMTMFYIDVDNLKTVNDQYGHSVGDQIIIDMADILKKTFRTSDVIARMGGDEFVIFGMSDSESESDLVFSKRLQENLEIFNKKTTRLYRLSCSVGAAHYDPQLPESLDDILSRADTIMYEEKLKKKEHQDYFCR